jgi:hypothetical protein
VHTSVQLLSGRPDVTLAQAHGTRRISQAPVRQHSSFSFLRLPHAQAFGRGQGVIVAVLDTGIAFNPVLLPVIRGGNFTTNDPIERTNPQDFHGHGTHVAGIVRGTAPASTILAIKVLGGNRSVSASVASANGIKAAVDAGARVLNLSYGGSDYDEMEARAIQYARSREVVVVAAAGNEGNSNPWYPAFLPNVIAVGNIAENNRRHFSSNFGPWVDISAPGVEILSTIPNGGVDSMTGTSQASPFVAGTAALILGRNRTLGAVSVEAQIKNNVIVPPQWDFSMGVGRLDALAALTRIDLLEAEPDDPIVGVDHTIALTPQARGVRDQVVALPPEIEMKWTSSDETIAEVDEDTGEVTGVSPGEVEIIAREATVSDAIEAYCRELGLGSVCPFEPFEAEARATHEHPRRRLRVTVVEDLVSGVYELVSFDGRPVPTALQGETSILSVLSGQIRLVEPTVGAPPDTPLLAGEHLRVLSNGSNPPVEVDHTPSYFYSVGDTSDVPVPFTHVNPLVPPTPVVMLPAGLVINGIDRRTNLFAPFATLAADGRTLSVGDAMLARHVGTYVRRMTRIARLEPINREITFDPTLQGQASGPETITVFNDGSDPLTVHPFVVFADGRSVNADYVVTGSCASVSRGPLGPGENCEFRIVFRPQLTYRQGPRAETLTIRTNAGSTSGANFRSVTFFLSGDATGAPRLTVNPSSATYLDTPAGTNSIPQTFILTNSGDLRLQMAGVSLASPDFLIETSSCSFGFFDPGQSCSVSVIFRPVVFGETIPRSAMLTITSNTGSVSGHALQSTLVPLSGNAAYGRPTANAGPDQSNVAINTNVVLDGRGSTDPQGLPLTFAWSLVSRPLGSRAVLLDGSERTARFVPDVDGTYIASLDVSNRFLTSPTDGVEIHVAAGPPPPPPPVGPAPVVTGLGHISVVGRWQLRFFGGDDDEPVWVKIGNDPEFEWEEDETPGRIVPIDFGVGPGTVRFAEDDNGEGLRPVTIEPLSDGRFLLHLGDDDPPFEIELTLVLERIP